MLFRHHWDPCIFHTGKDEIHSLIDDHFCDKKNIFFIAGAGFDPRSAIIANIFSGKARCSSDALLIREERPSRPKEQLTLAEKNVSDLSSCFRHSEIIKIDILSNDGAVIGGRTAVTQIQKRALNVYSDIVIDISALSIGLSFPIVKGLVLLFQKNKISANIHIFLAHQPELDALIEPMPSDLPTYIHGFTGGLGLDTSKDLIILWLPQMSIGRRNSLTKIHNFVSPHDTCPIIPFPASDPRLGDKIMEAYLTEFENAWSVDVRDIVYTAEDDPLMLYKTILELDDLRKPAFEVLGGSTLVLSPIGSKLMALGGLLAALERDLPIAYLESMGYSFAPCDLQGFSLYHLWLEGDVYPKERPPLVSYKSRNLSYVAK